MRRAPAILCALLISLATTVSLAQTQRADKVYRIGILSLLKRPSEQVFRDAMRDLGYVEGRNIAYEARYGEGQVDQLPNLAADLVRLKVDVIITAGGPAAEAAKQATSSVPIVLWGAGDPVGTGLVTNVSRPGGNITGITELSTELTSKRLQLFTETIPGLHTIAVVWNVGDHAMTLRFQEVETAAPGLRLTIMPLPIRKLDDFEAVFDRMTASGPTVFWSSATL